MKNERRKISRMDTMLALLNSDVGIFDLDRGSNLPQKPLSALHLRVSQPTIRIARNYKSCIDHASRLEVHNPYTYTAVPL